LRAVPVPTIAGAFLFEPTLHFDERGFFSRTFDRDVVRSVGIEPDAFAQDSLCFQALTEPADVSYRIDRAHDPAEDITIAIDDPELAVPWPLPIILTSTRDREAASLAAAMGSLT
jgi:dTDP-4-dehydrorhamnose 3,5-epimerase-like enzyme